MLANSIQTDLLRYFEMVFKVLFADNEPDVVPQWLHQPVSVCPPWEKLPQAEIGKTQSQGGSIVRNPQPQKHPLDLETFCVDRRLSSKTTLIHWINIGSHSALPAPPPVSRGASGGNF